MRRIAAVLVLLLTATAARAGKEDGGGLEVIVYGYICCATAPLILIFAVTITLAIYDWRKARRTNPPAPGE
jgi:hypothetical protein